MPTVYSIVEKSCEKYPKNTALVFKKKKYSYLEMKQEIDKVKLFFQNNCEKQDIVSLMMENSDSWILSYFGIIGAGCICNPLSLRTSDKNILFQIQFAKPKYILISSKFAEKCKRLRLDNFAKIISFEEIKECYSKEQKRKAEINENEYSSLMYTSGTKGLQKAVRLKHKTVFNATTNIVDYLKIKSDDIYYQILPLPHSFGLGNMHVTFLAGGTVVIADNTINYKKIIKEMIESKTSFFAAVPLTLKILCENFFEDFKKTGKFLRVICTNTGPMPTEITKKILENMKNTQFFTYYGLTEASRSSFMHFNAYPDKLKSVGKSLPKVKIKTINEKGEKTKSNKIGEICITGNNVVEEYWKNKESTNKSFKEEWLHTGDVGYFDEEEFLYIVGRDDDIVNIGGEKVSLQEVDNAIQQLPFVKDIACLEQEDDKREFNINAHVVLEEDKAKGKTKEEIEKEIIMHCKKYLDSFKVPQKVIYCKEVPKTDSGKTKRKVFRNRIGEKNG